jgi:hypothetical protein
MMKNIEKGRTVPKIASQQQRKQVHHEKDENVDYARSVFEGPEKTTIGGRVNGSQSKFLVETWPISQNLPDAPLF